MPDPSFEHPARESAAPVRREPLSARELLVLQQAALGLSVTGIARALYISPNTVKTHLRRIYQKLGVNSREDALRLVDELEE